MRGKIESVAFDINGETLLTLRLPSGRQDLPLLQSLAESDLDIELKKHREKRSRDANAYMWALIGQLAEKLRTTKDEVYLHYIRTVGAYDIFECRAEALPMLRASFKDAEIIDEWITGETRMEQVRCYYGTHLYNTEQFSRFLDEIIEDCKEQGIETETPEEKERLMQLWEQHQSCK